MMKKYDALIIGSGQAGTPLAFRLAARGLKVALVERDAIGGTCVNYGCTPTKAMVASAKNIYQAGRGSDYGFTAGTITPDINTIIDRKNKIVLNARHGNEQALKDEENIDVIYGEASFTGAKQINVVDKNGKSLDYVAEKIFINTGARKSTPQIDGLEKVPYLTSTSIMELNEIPEHLIILGGSYIAIEFGQMFRRFGSRVTMLERSPRFLQKEDEDVAQELKAILEGEGINVVTDVTIQQLDRSVGGHILVIVTVAGESKTIEGSHLLLAAGRQPNTDMLHLHKAGIETDDRGYIKVNDKLETNIDGIYALGDVKGGPAFTHISYNDYLVVYKNLYEGADVSIKDRPVPYCIFMDPELGRVGINEEEAKRKGIKYRVARLPMTHVARGIEAGETRGFMKAIVDTDTKLILGVAILGFGGGEIMSLLQIAMMGKLTYEQLKENIFAHPTYSEAINNLFSSLDKSS